MRMQMECCGAGNISDFESSLLWDRPYLDGILTNLSNGAPIHRVPVSCCKMNSPQHFPVNLDKLDFVNFTACLTNDETPKFMHLTVSTLQDEGRRCNNSDH